MKRFEDIKNKLNATGPGFCAAKWYNATVWLSNGRTASCHHPLAHYIPPKEIFNNFKALHNTEFKKEQRRLMLEGERPDECGYCWRVEDSDDNVYSDRIYKSVIYTDEEIDMIPLIPVEEDVDPKTLEISFDNLCNLSCTYCNPEFSSTWSNDIKTNGIYANMNTGGGQTYQNDGSHAYAFGQKDTSSNFYIQSFFEWFDNGLKESLQELRITGGEPTRSPEFWKLVDKCEGDEFKFAVNSNLNMDENRLQKLIDTSNKFNDFELFTSCETVGSHAELIRHGLDYDLWLNNLQQFTEKGSYKNIHVMTTISALVLFRITEFIDDIVALKRKYNNKQLYHMSVNILRFPSFQSVNILSDKLKQRFANEIEECIARNEDFMTIGEIEMYKRLVSYLRNVDASYEDQDSTEDKQNDFVQFYTQYTERRGINLIETMNDDDFTEWWESIQ